jgi:hypothetical protein
MNRRETFHTVLDLTIAAIAAYVATLIIVTKLAIPTALLIVDKLLEL